MIHEVIVSTIDGKCNPHVAPFGIWEEGGFTVIAPFKPSRTLENILATRCAVVNVTDDVRVFAAALTGRKAGSLLPTEKVTGFRLANTLAHKELRLVKQQPDELRPRLFFEVAHEAQHQPFQGFNRAQAAVIELAVLVSRLHRLPKDKVTSERQYLQIAIDKTAGERETEAWQWLTEYVDKFYDTTTC